MNHIVLHCPESGLEKFEEISYLLKQQREGKVTNISDFLRLSEDRAYSKPGKEAHTELTGKYLAKAKKFFEVSSIFISFR